MDQPAAVEQQLRDALRTLGVDLENDHYAADLYRALTRTRWTSGDATVALSFTRTEELVNELRGERGAAPLELAQTGGEGEVSDWAGDAIRSLGWTDEPLDTSQHDDAHLSSAEDEPRTEPQDSLAEGHREAEEGRPIPKQGTPGP